MRLTINNDKKFHFQYTNILFSCPTSIIIFSKTRQYQFCNYKMIKAIILSFLIITTFQALNCSLYDYSQQIISCVTSCPTQTNKINNQCLKPNQYIINLQVHTCRGVISANHSVCCPQNYYIENNQCLKCKGQVYNNGNNCCFSDHYLYYSQNSYDCVKIGTGKCPYIRFTSHFKVCCNNQQLYYVPTGQCKPSSGLNCDPNLFACCPNGEKLQYASKQYVCVKICSWKNSTISNFQCQKQYCTHLGNNIVSNANHYHTELLSFTTSCCYGIDTSNNCVTVKQNCINNFANRGWSICCLAGQYYSVAAQNCKPDCTTGFILFEVLCVTINNSLDLRNSSGKPAQITQGTKCNGLSMSSTFPVCCPISFYVQDNRGCRYCNGNIFTLIGYQKCCPFDHFFDFQNSECKYCDGVMDASSQLCCPIGSYIHYDTSGNSNCATQCSIDNIYKTDYCCDGLTQNCKTSYKATSCNPAVLISSSCAGCPGFCSNNKQLCASTQTNSCNGVCRLNQIYLAGLGCLECDVSCSGCTLPLSDANCISCASGFTLISNVCQICSQNCATCSKFTHFCTSCISSNKQILIGNVCIRYCLTTGYYLNNNLLVCQSCSPLCAFCTGNYNTSCIACFSAYYLINSTQSICYPCDKNCSSCYKSAFQCTKCSNGLAKSTNGICSVSCSGAIYYIYYNGPLCLPCHPNCKGCSRHPQNCALCRLNTTYLDNTLTINICNNCSLPCITCLSLKQCTSCAVSYFLSNFSCIKCDPSCSTCKGPSNNSCLSCYGSVNVSSSGSCNGCSSICQICSSNRCSICVLGYFLNSGFCMSFCPLQTYKLNATCLNCATTCLICNKSSCSTCMAGLYFILGVDCYEACLNGYSSKGRYCELISINNDKKDISSKYVLDQTVLIVNNQAFISLYVNTQSDSSSNITVSLINKDTGDTIPLISSSPMTVTNSKLSFSVQLPPNQDYNAYNLIETSGINSNGTFVSIVSSSDQLSFSDLTFSAIYNLRAMGYIFSAIMLLFILLTKGKDHFDAEEANNIILHAFNFAQVCYLFKFTTLLDEGGYFFLNGFGIAHLSFFPNFFKEAIPPFYIQNPIQNSLIPDGNLLRNSGFSFSFQLLFLVILIILIIISLMYNIIKFTDQPPYMRKIMRIGILLFHIGFMNQLFFAFVQIIQPSTLQPDYQYFSNSNINWAQAIIVFIPLIMVGFIYHYYKTYNSDVLQQYYTLREGALYVLICSQSMVMCLAVGKPLIGLFLIPLEIIWLIFNCHLSRYGTDMELSDYIKYFVICGSICVAYTFLSLQQQISWIVIVCITSITVITLLIYCSYQLVGIYYYSIFNKQKDTDST